MKSNLRRHRRISINHRTTAHGSIFPHISMQYLSVLLNLFYLDVCCKTTSNETVLLIFDFSYSLNIATAPVTYADFLVGIAANILLFRGAVGTKYLSALSTMVLPFEQTELFGAVAALGDAVAGNPFGRDLETDFVED